ncbi:cache domain-containing protein [Acidovorax sp.]|uniref:cache domain-containing protein n=1 Tax=Acidovorax sp. TaxID=1872122 RepID=UPI0026115ED3|nr:cache domain-containing protein [Acidovorax sp.]
MHPSSQSTTAIFVRAVLSAALLAGTASMAAGPGHGTRDEAIAMTKKAVAHFKSEGKDKALADFSRKGGAFVDRDLYVFVLDLNGKNIAHATNEKMIGRDLLQLKDADGKSYVIEMVEKAKTGKPAWIDYKWPNPLTKEIEAKSSYCEPVDGGLICVGVYK